MEITQLLSPSAVRVLPGITSKKRLFQEIGEIVEEGRDFTAGRAFDALQERESLGPTGVGNGIALPHARMPEVEEVCGVFVKLDHPLDFGAVDRLPVDLVFALFAPEDSGVDHLKALALVTRTLRNEGFCQKLRANDDAATLYTILTSKQGSRAA